MSVTSKDLIFLHGFALAGIHETDTKMYPHPEEIIIISMKFLISNYKRSPTTKKLPSLFEESY
jgi:hypothetical protein